MIIPDDKNALANAELAQLALGQVSLEQLPLYTPTESEDHLSALAGSRISLVEDFAPPTKPTNFLTLSRTNGSIRGSYLIDTELSIPETLLPALRSESPHPREARKNVQLDVTNGAIKVELRILPPTGPRASEIRPSTVSLSSNNGSISAKIHSTGTPLLLQASSQNGAVQLYLPRTFCGPLTIHVRNGVCISSSTLADEITVFGERGHTRHAFIGSPERSGWTRDPASWAGDSLTVETVNGSVKLCFLDDPPDLASVKSSAWSRDPALRASH